MDEVWYVFCDIFYFKIKKNLSQMHTRYLTPLVLSNTSCTFIQSRIHVYPLANLPIRQLGGLEFIIACTSLHLRPNVNQNALCASYTVKLRTLRWNVFFCPLCRWQYIVFKGYAHSDPLTTHSTMGRKVQLFRLFSRMPALRYKSRSFW